MKPWHRYTGASCGPRQKKRLPNHQSEDNAWSWYSNMGEHAIRNCCNAHVLFNAPHRERNLKGSLGALCLIGRMFDRVKGQGWEFTGLGRAVDESCPAIRDMCMHRAVAIVGNEDRDAFINILHKNKTNQQAAMGQNFISTLCMSFEVSNREKPGAFSSNSAKDARRRGKTRPRRERGADGAQQLPASNASNYQLLPRPVGLVSQEGHVNAVEDERERLEGSENESEDELDAWREALTELVTTLSSPEPAHAPESSTADRLYDAMNIVLNSSAWRRVATNQANAGQFLQATAEVLLSAIDRHEMAAAGTNSAEI